MHSFCVGGPCLHYTTHHRPVNKCFIYGRRDMLMGLLYFGLTCQSKKDQMTLRTMSNVFNKVNDTTYIYIFNRASAMYLGKY